MLYQKVKGHALIFTGKKQDKSIYLLFLNIQRWNSVKQGITEEQVRGDLHWEALVKLLPVKCAIQSETLLQKGINGKTVQYPPGALTPHLSNRTQTALYPPSSTIMHFNQVPGITTFPCTKVIFLGLISLVPWFAGLGTKYAAALHIPPLLKWNKCLLMDASTCLTSKEILSLNGHSLQLLFNRNTQELSDQVFLQDNSIFITASNYNSFYILVLPWHQSLITNHTE